MPAWPPDWDADFKLHLAQETVVRGKVAGGKLVDWSIEPAARRNDEVIHSLLEPGNGKEDILFPKKK